MNEKREHAPVLLHNQRALLAELDALFDHLNHTIQNLATRSSSKKIIPECTPPVTLENFLLAWHKELSDKKDRLQEKLLTQQASTADMALFEQSVLQALLDPVLQHQMDQHRGPLGWVNALLSIMYAIIHLCKRVMGLTPNSAGSERRAPAQASLSFLTSKTPDFFFSTRTRKKVDEFSRGVMRLRDNHSSVNRPLVIASSGGGGHIAAAKGIVDDWRLQSNVDIISHRAVLYKDRQSNPVRYLFDRLLYLKSIGFISDTLTFAHQTTGVADVLDPEAIQQEIGYLKANASDQPTRPYVDLLLDHYAFGYEMAAIFNALQRQDKTKELRSTVSQQGITDRVHYPFLYQEVVSLLRTQQQIGRPYSSVISTQPQSLAAICDAVLWYNKTYKPSTKLRVAQYMTDLPTAGATHFLQALVSLTDKQRACMDVYCLGTPDSKFTSLNKLNVLSLRPEENPMLRVGFRQTEKLAPYTDRDREQTLVFQVNDALQQQVIPAQAHVASIMLGSLGGDASIEYVLPLLEKGYTHLFLFGMKGNKKLEALMHELTLSQQACIIPLGNQGDETIAPIMTRSDCVITRSGGLSTMEQMALPLIANKRVLIHHKNPKDDSAPLSAGLSWEDGNADCLIAHLEQHGAQAKKTCPARAWADIAEVGPQVVRPLLF